MFSGFDSTAAVVSTEISIPFIGNCFSYKKLSQGEMNVSFIGTLCRINGKYFTSSPRPFFYTSIVIRIRKFRVRKSRNTSFKFKTNFMNGHFKILIYLNVPNYHF